MTPKRWVALGIAVVLLGISVLFQMVSTFASVNFSEALDMNQLDGDVREEVVETGTEGKVVVLDLDGVIQDTGSSGMFAAPGYDHQLFKDMLDNAMEDPVVDGIILNVNTPGGGVVESEEIHDKIVQAREEYDKTVYVSMGAMAASGGYYVAAPADYISAHPATLTGSIGVIMQSFNFSELANDLGIEENTIKSGPYKDIMSMTRDMTDEEREILESIAGDMFDDFVNVIVEGRDMSESTVRDLADGRIYTGKQAVDNDLIDGLATLDEMIELMKENLEIQNAQVVRYSGGQNFGSLWGMTLETIAGRGQGQLANIESLIQENSAPQFMYLYQE